MDEQNPKQSLFDDLIFGVPGIAAETGLKPHQVNYLIRKKRLPVTHLGPKTIVASRGQLRRFAANLAKA